jgi:hypothetical protein
MTPKQQAAMQQLAAALGVPQRKPITKDQAGRVLAEALGSMANHRQHAGEAIKPTPIPKDSALADLHRYLSGTDDKAQRDTELQQQIDDAVAKALKAHGVTAADQPNLAGDLATAVQKAFADAAARITDDEEK